MIPAVVLATRVCNTRHDSHQKGFFVTTTISKKELLDYDDVASLCDVSTQTLRRWWRQGLMPAPRRFGRRLVRWRREVIEQWISEQNEDE